MVRFIVEGDATSHGGKVISGSDGVKLRGHRVARKGDFVSCPLHGGNEIMEGSYRMKDGNVELALDGPGPVVEACSSRRPAPRRCFADAY